MADHQQSGTPRSDGSGTTSGSGSQKTQLSWGQPASSSTTTTTSRQSTTSSNAASSAMAQPPSRLIGTFVAGLVIGLLVAWAWFDLRSTGESKPGATGANTGEFAITKTAGGNAGASATGTGSGASVTGSAQTEDASASISVPPEQKAGNTVEVASVAAASPVWVIVYANADRSGQVMGAARFATKKSGTIELVHPTVAGTTYYVGLANDTPDRTYRQPMAPLTGADGKQVMTQFVAK